MSATTPPTERTRRAYRPPAPLGGRSGRGARRQRRRALTPIAFLAPALLVLGVFVGWPMISAFLSSFTDSSGFGEASFVGLDNYQKALTDLDILGATAFYTVLFVPTALVVALGLAMLVNHPDLPGRNLFRTVLFLPFIVSLSVAAFAWGYLLDPQIGLLNHWLRGWGIQLGNVLQDPTLAMPTVVLVAVWKTFGFYLIILLAGLQQIPESLYEAARIDGAGSLRQFRHITLPQLSNTLAFVLIFAMIAALQAFDQIYVLTGGGPYRTTQTIVMEIYQEGFRKLNLGFASALSYVLLAATLMLSLVQFWFFGRREKDVGA